MCRFVIWKVLAKLKLWTAPDNPRRSRATMGWNADGTCTSGGGGFNANRSSVSGGVFGTDDPPPSREPRRDRNVNFLDELSQAEQRDQQQQMQMQRQQQMAMQQQRQMQQQQQQQMAVQQQRQMQQQQQQQMAMQQQRQMQQQQQQQMAVQQQRQMQQQQQQQMAMQEQRQMQLQQQQQMAMQQQRQIQMQQQQRQQQQQQQPETTEYQQIQQRNSVSSISLGGGGWDESAASYRGGKVRKGVETKLGGNSRGGQASMDMSVAAGSAMRLDADGRQGGGARRPPGGGSSISLGSDTWASSPRQHQKMARGMQGAPPQMHTGGAYFDAPAAGGAARYDNRAHLGSNITF